MHLCAAARQRQRDDRVSRRDLLAAARAVVGDLAGELMAQDDPLVGAHEAVVARLDEDVGRLVGVVACVEVGPADPAAQHVEEDLPLCRLGLLEVRDLELRVFADDRLHVLVADAAAAAGASARGRRRTDRARAPAANPAERDGVAPVTRSARPAAPEQAGGKPLGIHLGPAGDRFDVSGDQGVSGIVGDPDRVTPGLDGSAGTVRRPAERARCSPGTSPSGARPLRSSHHRRGEGC